ncbi:MAG: GNAT family N-acetyltransferase [Anaerolineaceae bacterium]|nr:GNAT family N-acetyltransferase [Anaerolineaceae bacterium]
MALATWWASDPLMDLAPLSNFQVCLSVNDVQMAAINHLTVAEVEDRRQAGNLPYVGYMGEIPVTYGWVATREASIGELNLIFPIPVDNRYLWDFATLPEWQGRGLYPRLLQAIVQMEQAERLWIIHAPENRPSGAGMQKAGFQAVGQLSFQNDSSIGLIPFDQPERARIGAALLGVPLIEDGLSPCWRCVDQVVCTCQRDPESCSCAVEIR